MNKKTSAEIINTLREIIPNPKCELNYNNLFELIVSVVLSAQTTDKRVNQVTAELFLKYPDSQALMCASIEDVKKIINPVGLASSKAKNIIALGRAINELNDEIPNTLDSLMALPGVGRKTASVVLIEGFKIPAMPVDTHLLRMAKRFKYIDDGNVLDAENAYKKYIPQAEWKDAHHLILLFGRYYCTAKKPKCEGCKLQKFCKK